MPNNPHHRTLMLGGFGLISWLVDTWSAPSSTYSYDVRLCAGKTHRELFSEFYADLMKEPLEKVLRQNPRPFWATALFGQMMRDLQNCAGHSNPIEQVYPLYFNTNTISGDSYSLDMSARLQWVPLNMETPYIASEAWARHWLISLDLSAP